MTVKSAQRVVDIFELFAVQKKPVALSALASALRLPKSSCLALLKTLSSKGYLYEIGAREGYYPTRRWLHNAEVIAGNEPLVQNAHAFLVKLSEEIGETLILAKLAREQIQYLDVVEASQTLRYTAAPGQLKPLHGTGSGKAAMSALDKKTRTALIRSLDMRRITPRTVTSRAALEKEIEAGIVRGWHVSIGENAEGATAVAVPVRMAGDTFVLVAAGLSERMEKRIPKIGERLRSVSRQFEDFK
jgi:DNA-binding IclR family transcriptional regulator